MSSEPRRVLMSPDLMGEWATRDTNGNLLSWWWGEPDAEGFYTPTITAHYDDNLVAAYRADLEARVRALPGLDPGYHAFYHAGFEGARTAVLRLLTDGAEPPERGVRDRLASRGIALTPNADGRAEIDRITRRRVGPEGDAE